MRKYKHTNKGEFDITVSDPDGKVITLKPGDSFTHANRCGVGKLHCEVIEDEKVPPKNKLKKERD